MRPVRIMLGGLLLVGATSTPNERVITGDGIIDVRIAGVAARLQVDPAAPSMPLISSEAAQRAGLIADRNRKTDARWAIEDLTLIAPTNTARVNFGSGETARRVGWIRVPHADGADGFIGPSSLPEAVVRFYLRPPRPGERIFSLPMMAPSASYSKLSSSDTAYARIDAAGEPIRVRFEPYRPVTLVSARAGTRIARMLGGTVSGPATMTPIFLGMDRPIRTLTLRQPFQIGHLRITKLGIRISDYGRVSRFGQVELAPHVIEPSEVLVIGKGRKRSTRNDVISIGQDYLSRCSSIVFDRRKRAISLSCG